DQEGQTQGPWNPAHPARQPGTQPRSDAETATQGRLSPTHQDRERLRLGCHKSGRTLALLGGVDERLFDLACHLVSVTLGRVSMAGWRARDAYLYRPRCAENARSCRRPDDEGPPICASGRHLKACLKTGQGPRSVTFCDLLAAGARGFAPIAETPANRMGAEC